MHFSRQLLVCQYVRSGVRYVVRPRAGPSHACYDHSMCIQHGRLLVSLPPCGDYLLVRFVSLMVLIDSYERATRDRPCPVTVSEVQNWIEKLSLVSFIKVKRGVEAPFNEDSLMNTNLPMNVRIFRIESLLGKLGNASRMHYKCMVCAYLQFEGDV